MNIPRRVRIQGKVDTIKGYMMALYDADTGEIINGVQHVELVLDATQNNHVEITIDDQEYSLDSVEINDVIAIPSFKREVES